MIDLLKTPLKDLTTEQRQQAFLLLDERNRKAREENRRFTPMKYTKVAVHSDDMGLKGVLNHADGRRYDSKSEFRKATRRAGCYEMGNDVKEVNYKTPLERGVRGDFNVRPELKDAVQKVMR